jgi:DNA-binding winged helix-turn-helix (wHTH) protein
MAKKFRAVSPGARVVENVHGRGYKMTANPGGVER